MRQLVPHLLLLIALAVSSAPAQELVQRRGEFYTIHTDLPEERAREVQLRMHRMAQEYIARTRGFAGAVNRQMPFYLYADAEKYYATGAARNSAGYFNGRELVAQAQDLGPRMWHTVQHEAFHQFADQVIRGELPMWLSEGLAEYFGEALYTGDGFVSGVIPQWRLKRVRETFAARKFRPLPQIMTVSRDEWNNELAIANYDQAWSMVQFLAHGEDGKYQQGLARFISLLGDNRRWEEAWRTAFGDIQGLEAKWREYWTGLPDNPTLDLYAQANVATLNSFLARAQSQQQRFTDFSAFEKAAAEGTLKSHPQDWLPPALLKQALADQKLLVRSGHTYTLTARRGQQLPLLVCTTPSGKQIEGRYTLRSGRVGTTSVEIVTSPGR